MLSCGSQGLVAAAMQNRLSYVFAMVVEVSMNSLFNCTTEGFREGFHTLFEQPETIGRKHMLCAQLLV